MQPIGSALETESRSAMGQGVESTGVGQFVHAGRVGAAIGIDVVFHVWRQIQVRQAGTDHGARDLGQCLTEPQTGQDKSKGDYPETSRHYCSPPHTVTLAGPARIGYRASK